MKLLWLLVAFAANLATVIEAPASDPVEAELKKLAGDWTVVSAEQNGELIPAGYLKTLKVTFKGDRVSVQPAGSTEPDPTIKVDPTKKPKQIDGGCKVKGIYDLEGDTLTIRLAYDGLDRPPEFAGKTQQNEILLVLKRAKP